ncbi:MAG: carboxypeptidase-like regulatory domain-containing protein [Pedobacter sp.]|nr:MAG: carboxypeptidase-like regulatory domain-containing protein [Pedobacter sp.]
MKDRLLLSLFLLVFSFSFSQTKVSGVVLDENKKPIPYANVAFLGTSEGIVTNEDGLFYLESKETRTVLQVSFIGYSPQEIKLDKPVTYNLKVVLSLGEELAEVKIYTGKTSKKNNPAIDILRKIWERKRKNGLRQFKQYEMEKYEKIEFDMNTIDSAFMKKKIFKGMEFIFNSVDTSKITGKTYLPIFINEALSNVYGDNVRNQVKEVLVANKNSGFSNNQQIIAYVSDLYADYDIYDNYLKFFDKSFTSPLSRTGIDVYNYVLTDSSYIDNKWCYNIVYYPRRKGELTFKGNFWVNDTTWAIKKINLEVTKSANINWVKDIYIEQEFEVLNDSVFLLQRDYMMTDFALSKKEKSRGVYGKRTTMFRNHIFDKERNEDFYKEEINNTDPAFYLKPDEFWEENRFEHLNKDEKGVYKMLDTLQTNKKFLQIYDAIQIIGSGYINIHNIDVGPLLSTFGYNEVEGLRVRLGGRTYFGENDPWRIQAYTAYGFKDNKFKYGISGKWMVEPKNRLILSFGTRRDVEQIGASFTDNNDVMSRSFASSSLFTAGNNGKLTNVNLTTFSAQFEPAKNFTIQGGITYKTLISASEDFSMDYYTVLPTVANPLGETRSRVTQSEFNLMLDYSFSRKTVGSGVERRVTARPFAEIYLSYSQGLKDVINSDFDYKKVQLYYRQPLNMGGIGRLDITTELGKTFGEVPLALMSIVPGNQTYWSIPNTFNLLDFYEFQSDAYATLQLQHNFGGRIFSRIPFLRKLNWRETIGFKGVYGTISNENRSLNASGLIYRAPEDFYYEYNAGIGNIFKVLRIECAWRGNYITPSTNNFGVKASLGINF